MAGDLLTRPTPRRPATLDVRGRVLYLADDTALVRAQLYEGLDLELSDELRARLRDQISTDEITPAYICFFYDETLGEFPYLGLRTTNGETGAEEYPIGRASVRTGGFTCSVAGKRRGKGSSREQSPYAELMAGIRVVVSESIERIYNENCQNLGVLTTTDFGVAERIARGEPLRLPGVTPGQDENTRQIIQEGGRFCFNRVPAPGRRATVSGRRPPCPRSRRVISSLPGGNPASRNGSPRAMRSATPK
ncbi:MAG: hypothetical protein OXE73_05680, partial [Gammaproteobacteria bacterium]|nr:hypothetical protein [Gammaproteobacteria bacterium]